MRKLFLTMSILASSFMFGQMKFDCYNISRTQVLNKYYDLKHFGIDYKFPKGGEVIPVMLEKVFNDAEVGQLCINAAYRSNKIIGINNLYPWYKQNVKNISENDFNRNYDYLMIYEEIILSLEKTINYKRRR